MSRILKWEMHLINRIQQFVLYCVSGHRIGSFAVVSLRIITVVLYVCWYQTAVNCTPGEHNVDPWLLGSLHQTRVLQGTNVRRLKHAVFDRILLQCLIGSCWLIGRAFTL